MDEQIDAAITTLEELLNQIEQIHQLEPDRLAALPDAWNVAVARLAEVTHDYKKDEKSPERRVRLQAVIDRIPAALSSIALQQNEISQKLHAENKRFQSMHRNRYSHADLPRLVTRKV